jgi:hypothetical protein
MDLFTLAYAQSVSPQVAAADATMAQALITPVSRMIESFCRGTYFYARRFSADPYDSPGKSYLSLHYAPLIQLNSLTIWPDSNPTIYQASDFDIVYPTARLNFKPDVNGSFWWDYGPRRMPISGRNVILADYFAGYGYVTSLSAAVAPGNNVVLPLSENSGFTTSQGPWTVQTGSLLLDSDQATEEEVTVTVAGGVATAASVANNHASGAFVSGPRATADVQFAAACVLANILASPDLTKKMEGIGRIGGYVSQLRDHERGVYFSPEIAAILSPYRNVVA